MRLKLGLLLCMSLMVSPAQPNKDGAEEFQDLIDSLTRWEIMRIIPRAVNDNILEAGGRIQTEPAVWIIGVRAVPFTITYTYVYDIDAINQTEPGITEEHVRKSLNSNAFKEKVINGTCSDPKYFALLDRGFDLEYVYQLESAARLASFNVARSAC